MLRLFFWVLFVQIFILNNLQFSGYINPYYYIVFILTAGSKTTKFNTIIYSFFLGLIIDVFSYSYGIHAFSSVLISYIQLNWFSKISDHKDVEFIIDINKLNFQRYFNFIAFFVFLHHFTLFFLESCDINDIFSILKTTFLSSVFTIILLLLHTVFNRKKI